MPNSHLMLLAILSGILVVVILILRGHRRMKKRLAKERAVFNNIVELNPYSIVVFDKDGHFVRANKAFVALFGSLPRKDYCVFEDEILKEYGMLEELGKVKRGEPAQSTEMWYNPNPDPRFHDKRLYMRASAFPIDDDNGNLEFLVSMHEDITERKLAEEALEESNERYRSLFEDSPISLWQHDFSAAKRYLDELKASGVGDLRAYFEKDAKRLEECGSMFKIEDINKATLELFEAGTKEQLLNNLEAIATGETSRLFIDVLDAVARGERDFESEGVFYTLRGKKRYASLRWSVPPGYEKTFGKVLVSIMDITERKMLEDEVRKALKMKSDFMATVSHELRTPLSRIIACADLVRRDKALNLPGNRVKDLEHILNSSDALLYLINNILEMARIESGMLPIRIQTFRLKDMVDGCIVACEGLIENKPLKFINHVDENLGELFTDREKLSHIINNLISNAIKFSDEGKIEIGTKDVVGRDAYLRIYVKDEGIGIPQDRQEMIFTRFSQIDEVSTRRYGGIGLGLSIVKALLDIIGGQIEVESHVGKGSTFTITIPKILSVDSDLP